MGGSGGGTFACNTLSKCISLRLFFDLLRFLLVWSMIVGLGRNELAAESFHRTAKHQHVRHECLVCPQQMENALMFSPSLSLSISLSFALKESEKRGMATNSANSNFRWIKNYHRGIGGGRKDGPWMTKIGISLIPLWQTMMKVSERETKRESDEMKSMEHAKKTDFYKHAQSKRKRKSDFIS